MNHEHRNAVLDQNPLNKSLMAARPGRLVSPPSGASLTQQQYKDECNPNNVIARYNKTGELHHIRTNQPMFVDMTSLDFVEMREQVARIEENFMQLPAATRKHFKHDPKQLLAFLEDPQNREEGIKLGLINPSKAEEPSKPKESSSGAA